MRVIRSSHGYLYVEVSKTENYYRYFRIFISYLRSFLLRVAPHKTTLRCIQAIDFQPVKSQIGNKHIFVDLLQIPEVPDAGS